MTRALLVAFGLAALGCGGGGADAGDDTLPKRGERDTDPTIVAATASCDPQISIPEQPAPPDTLSVRVSASDPMGQDNLGNCIGESDGSSDEGTFGSGSAGACFLEFKTPCTAGSSYAVDITVANKTGGVTTASVTVRAD